VSLLAKAIGWADVGAPFALISPGPSPRFAITLLFVAVVSYFWGGFMVYKRIFPYRQIQNLKNRYVGDSLT
jgi:hypothetical protein